MRSTLVLPAAFVLFVALLSGCTTVSGKGSSNMTVSKEVFGTLPDGRTADLYTITNGNGVRARITNFGGIVVSLETPDKGGKLADIVLGYDSIEGYLENKPYFGCIAGRFANRIAKGKFALDGTEYTLATNNGVNHLHGGIAGFNKVLWNAKRVNTEDAAGVRLHYVSENGEEGYPGTLTCTVTYLLSNANELRIDYDAVTDAPTIVNLTHHGYFNLAGQGTGDILGHELMINADHFTPVDATMIPAGELRPVAGTPFDFTQPMVIGARINNDDEQLKFGLGYDHNFVLNGDGLRLIARATEATSGRVMEMYTTEPGVQFYSGNFLDGTEIGKGGVAYQHRFGFCLESQHFPDSPNQPAFPPVVLRPGKRYSQTTIYRFSTE